MAERSNAAVLKTVDCHRSGGSNPSLSALQLLMQRSLAEFVNRNCLGKRIVKALFFRAFYFYIGRVVIRTCESATLRRDARAG